MLFDYLILQDKFMEVKIYTYYSDYANSYDYYIRGEFGLENLKFPALHIWKTYKYNGIWYLQFAVADSPYKIAEKYLETIREVSSMHGIPKEIYLHIFNLIFRMDDYEAFQEYKSKNEISVDRTNTEVT